jgi:7-carboxy-7-deazaguanine synthase
MTEIVYPVAEKFKSLQGEGVYAGTPMAFVRFVGCSVGKTICQHCDTDFDKLLNWRGGGTFEPWELIEWANPYDHICLTGGEPLDQPLRPLLELAQDGGRMLHIETSGTVLFNLLDLNLIEEHWVCVSPKPGWKKEMIDLADEVKVIVPGLGNGEGWPTLDNALEWAYDGKVVFLQPRNAKFDVDKQNLLYVQDLIRDHPVLRLSVQLHKILKVQ